MDICFNYSSHCDKIFSRNNLKKANGLRRIRPSWQVWCGWSHGEMRQMLNSLSSLFPFVQFWITSPGTVTATFRTAFPPQVNVSANTLTDTPRGVCLLAALNPIKLTTKVNQHMFCVCKRPSGSEAGCVHHACV